MAPINNDVLVFPPNVVYEVRKRYNLEKPGSMDAAIDILEQWIRKQNHFLKKDFDRFYLETGLLTTKGSIEKAKARLDKQCTLRTLIPNYFGDFNVKTDLGGIREIIGGVLSEQCNDYTRVFAMKNVGSAFTPEVFINFYRKTIILAEYLRKNDFTDGFHLIIDISMINVMDLITHMSPVELRKILTILMEGFGMRIRGIHLISKSKAVEIFAKLMRSILSEKVGDRIHVHEEPSGLYKFIPREMLPCEWGGDNISLHKLDDKWQEVLSSPEHLKFLKEMNGAKTDESKRISNKFTEDYLGMPGSFKKLSVD